MQKLACTDSNVRMEEECKMKFFTAFKLKEMLFIKNTQEKEFCDQLRSLKQTSLLYIIPFL